MMEGFCFVISIAGLKGPQTGKSDDILNWTVLIIGERCSYVRIMIFRTC
jgi:hypothetical protein